MVTTVSEFTSAAVSDRGLNESRPENEDSFLELPQYGLFAVADGVGGSQAGEVASQMAVEILGEAFVNMGQNADPEDTMRVALERANEAIFQMSHDIPQLSSMATTIAAVHVSGDMATIAHVGDSRVYRVDGNDRLFRETDDHSIVEEEVRAGRMTPEQALNHPSRNVISRALGAEETVLPDIKCVLIHPGTTFLLCSDGITRHIEDAEIEQLLSSDFGPEDICSRMKDICFSRGAEDNLTAVVLRFPGEPQLTAVAPEDDEDIEELTLAGVREPVLADADTDENIEVPNEVYQADGGDATDSSAVAETAGPSETVDTTENEAYLLEHPESIYSDEAETRPIAETSADDEATADPIPARATAGYDVQPGIIESSAESRSFSPVTMLLIGLIVGSAIGALAGYFTLRSSFQSSLQAAESRVAISEQKSGNVPLTSFEETRRLVDKDPAGYVNARAITPREAGDFFWLGRALLLTRRPVEARRAFEQARNLLPQVQERDNVKTMAHEIAMALAIVDNPEAVEAFAKEVEAANAAIGQNSNANTADNTMRPATHE